MGKHNTAKPGTLGGRIQKARVEMGLPQWKLAMHCGLAVETIKAAEQVNKFGRFDTIVKIAEALDISLYYLAGLQDEYGTFGEYDRGQIRRSRN